MKVTRMPPAGSLRGAILDLDGTLTRPILDFDAIRAEIGIKEGATILEALEHMTPAERARADVILDRHEMGAAEQAQLNDGVLDFVRALAQRGVLRALLTRNSRRAVGITLERCGLQFDTIVAREDGPPKPDPTTVNGILAKWQLPPIEAIVIGDFRFDIEVGQNAGTWTALITHGQERPFADEADVAFDSFETAADRLLTFFVV